MTGQALADRIDAVLARASLPPPTNDLGTIAPEAIPRVDAPDLLQIGSVSSA